MLAEFFGADTPFEIGTEFPGLPARTYASIQEVTRHLIIGAWVTCHFRLS